MPNEKDNAVSKTVRSFVSDATHEWKPDEKTKVLEIRTGEAQKIEYPVKVSVDGVTSAPYEFFKKRIDLHNLHDPNRVHLLVDKVAGTLVLVVDETYDKGTEIKGSIQDNPYLKEFFINTDKTFRANDLAKILKTRKMWFSDPNQCGNLVHNLLHFEGEWSTRVRQVDNQKGRTHSSIERELKSEVPLKFGLTIPPFKGFEAKTFEVEVMVQYQHSDITFYLESIELMQLQLELKVAEIESQVKSFEDKICIFEV